MLVENTEDNTKKTEFCSAEKAVGENRLPHRDEVMSIRRLR